MADLGSAEVEAEERVSCYTTLGQNEVTRE